MKTEDQRRGINSVLVHLKSDTDCLSLVPKGTPAAAISVTWTARKPSEVMVKHCSKEKNILSTLGKNDASKC